MSMVLTRDKEHLVLENMKLVHHVMTKLLHVSQSSPDYEDMASEGIVGLIKAAMKYDPSKGEFSTYATPAIRNTIFQYCKVENRHSEEKSVDEPTGDDSESNRQNTLLDTIACPKSNFPKRIEEKEYGIRLMNIILNCLNRIQRSVLLYSMGRLGQEEIAEKVNKTRTEVAMYKKRAVRKAVEIESSNRAYTKVFLMEIVGDEYEISFSSKKVKGFKRIFKRTLKKVKSSGNFSYCKVSFNGPQVVIQLPPCSESFYFIAQLFEEIDNYNMCASQKN